MANTLLHSIKPEWKRNGRHGTLHCMCIPSSCKLHGRYLVCAVKEWQQLLLLHHLQDTLPQQHTVI